MIKAFIIMNDKGQPRMLKFYESLSDTKVQNIVSHLHRTLNLGDPSCSFLEAPEPYDSTHTLVVRSYATLHFCVVIDDAESPSSIFSFVQQTVEVLDSIYEKVSELHIIFNSSEISLLLDEIIVGGIINNIEDDLIDRYKILAK
ncbi:hypothetical protein PCE1_001328 [Barthelona sp. PCE]